MAIAGTRIDPVSALADPFRVDRADPSHFRPHLDDLFTVVRPDGSGRVRVRLARVHEKPPSAGVARFTLIFWGHAATPLPDGIYPFEHRAFGSFPIFISQVGAGAGERRAYQACFSRHVRT